MCRPRLGRRRERLEIASRAEESAGAGQHHHLRRVGVAERRGVGELASHRVVHAVCGVGPVQGDSRDRAGLLELDGLVFGHAWTLSPVEPGPGRVHPHMALSRAVQGTRDEGEDGCQQAEDVPAHRGRAQVRRGRSDGVAVVRGAFGGGAGGAVAVAAARGRLLRHAGTRPGGPPRHAAPAHRRVRRRLAPQAARGRRTPAPRSGRRSDEGVDDDVPDDLRDVVLAIVRDRPLAPVARISTNRTVDLLYGADGSPLAEFCDDKVTASAGEDGEAAVARVGAGAGRGRRRRRRTCWTGWPTGCSTRARRPRGTARNSPGCWRAPTTPKQPKTPTADPVHRAVAEQVESLVEWDRAVRADVVRLGAPDAGDDAQDPQPAAGVGGCVRDLRRRVGPRRAAAAGQCAGRRARRRGARRAVRDARWTSLPDELVRGPVRERLVEGAKRRYQSGLRRSLVAMRSERYFRLLDALEGLVAAEPTPTAGGEEEPRSVTIDSAYKRVRKAAKRAAAGRRRRTATRRCTESARAPSDFDTPRRQPARTSVSTGQEHPDAARRPSGQRGQPHAPGRAGRGRSCAPARTPSPTGCCTQLEDDLARSARASNSTAR